MLMRVDEGWWGKGEGRFRCDIQAGRCTGAICVLEVFADCSKAISVRDYVKGVGL